MVGRHPGAKKGRLQERFGDEAVASIGKNPPSPLGWNRRPLGIVRI